MKTLNNFLETPEHLWIKKGFWNMGKYVTALKHIEEHTPKFIVEYGGGQSTLMLTEFVNYLDYGGKVVGYESDEYWYNFSLKKGWNKYNNIKLIDIVEDTYQPDENYHKARGVRYVHPIEDIEGVDFVILDGPALQDFESGPNVTFNLMDIVNHLGYEIPYFIDGRSGTRNFYGDNSNLPNAYGLDYKTDIGDEKK